MPETAVYTSSDEVVDHPAVRAWRRVRPAADTPQAVELVRRKSKSEIWRILRPRAEPLIAKLCDRGSGQLERTIYEEILPGIPVASVRCHGWTPEPVGERAWLFLDDAGDVPFTKSRSDRILAARWLGGMHGSAQAVAALARLPERGPAHYREHLRDGRDRILRNLPNPALSPDDRGVLSGIIRQLERAESHWEEVEERCASLPRTLVHGDFTRKNVRIRRARGGLEVLAIDWEVAGVGIPGPDLLYVDLDAYLESVARVWPDVDGPKLATLLALGRLFRGLLAAIDWRSRSLSYRWVDGAMADFRLYHARMDESLRELGWRA